MGLWKQLFGRRVQRDRGTSLALLFNHLGGQSGAGQAGANLAVIFNNTTEQGASALGCWLDCASEQDIASLAAWIALADEDALVRLARYMAGIGPVKMADPLTYARGITHATAAPAPASTTAIGTVDLIERDAHATILVTCPQCAESARASADAVGRKARCNRCGHEWTLQPCAEKSRRAGTEGEMVALRDAAFSGQTAIVLSLLQLDVDVDTPLPNGDRLLASVACMGDARYNITRLLVEHGADVNCRICGTALLQWLRQPTYTNNDKTIALLQSRGARP